MTTTLAQATPATMNTAESGYAPVNGLEMYYEIHGVGEPLLLLHGGLTTIDMSFGMTLPVLAERRQVIAVEQQAHGHTADIDRPLTFEQMADDTAALLQYLDIEQADVFGYSMGGILALGFAIRYPELVRKLAVAGANFNNDGYYPAVFEPAPADAVPEPLREAYIRVAPNPDDFPTLFTKVSTLMGEFGGWPPDDLQAIAAPTLVIIGDADFTRPEHAVELYRLRGGGVAGDLAGLPASQLAILPGTTHVTLMLEDIDLLLTAIDEFLSAPMPAAG